MTNFSFNSEYNVHFEQVRFVCEGRLFTRHQLTKAVLAGCEGNFNSFLLLARSMPIWELLELLEMRNELFAEKK